MAYCISAARPSTRCTLPEHGPEATRECLICGRVGAFDLVYRREGEVSALVRCPDCGLVFRHPQPDHEALQRSYYHDPEFTVLLAGPLREFTLKRASEHRCQLESLGIRCEGMKILDVGCSSGAWLQVAAAHGALVEGVEVGESTASEARRRGLQVHTGTLAECVSSLSQRSYDLITFWDVLEHLRDPRVELALAERLLAARGHIAATFPNVEGLYPRITHRLLARRTGVWEYPEEVHMHEFAPETARRLFAAQGFDRVTLKTVPTPFVFYRNTALSREQLGRGARAALLRLAFELLHLVVYPVARLSGRDNSLLVLAERSSAGA